MPVTTYTTIDGEIVSQDVNGAVHDLLPDPLGHTVALLGSGQGIEFEYTYWPYEEVGSIDDVATTLRFCGTLGYYSDDYGSPRVYVRARHYRGPYGRWLTVDPLWPKDAPYEYAWCNPVTIYDPSGLTPLWCDSCMMKEMKNPRKTMFGACMTCNKHLGVTAATAKCKKYPTKPLPRSTFDFFSAISGSCCADSSGLYSCESCCLEISSLLGTSTFIGGLFSDPRIPSCANCLQSCKDACNLVPTPGNDVTAGLKACLEGPKLELLDFVLIFLESQ